MGTLMYLSLSLCVMIPNALGMSAAADYGKCMTCWDADNGHMLRVYVARASMAL